MTKKIKHNKIKAPFAWTGGKSRSAEQMLKYLDGDDGVKRYMEPFAGSIATLLKRKEEHWQNSHEVVNDFDGMIINAWRAITYFPKEVAAKVVEQPVSAVTLQAYDFQVRKHRNDITDRLRGDPKFCDVEIAAMWIYGQSHWIGQGWSTIEGPWFSVGGVLKNKDELETDKQGTRKQTPVLKAKTGLFRKLPEEKGTWKQVPKANVGCNLSAIKDRQTRLEYAEEWLEALKERLIDVKFLQGDFKANLTNSVLVGNNKEPKHPIGVLLDPPYDPEAQEGMAYSYYSTHSLEEQTAISVQTRMWCIDNNERAHKWLRIVLCGRAEEHDELLDYGWRKERVGKTAKGFTKDAGDARRKEEMIWISPACPEYEETNETE